MVGMVSEAAARHRLLQQFHMSQMPEVARTKSAPSNANRVTGKTPQAMDAPAGINRISVNTQDEFQKVPDPKTYRAQNPDLMGKVYGEEDSQGQVPGSLRQRTQKTYDRLTQNQRRATAEMMQGEPGMTPEIRKIIGEAKSFEDALMAIMMHIAQNEQGRVMRRLRNFERTTTGVGRFMRDQASNVAEFGGGMVGQALGGPPGAALGRQVGKSAADSALGGEQSRQLEFEKIKFMMQKLNEMVSCLSNVLNIMHTTAQATIQNTRG